jgi:hypothetical protein
MDFLNWLQGLGSNANLSGKGFHARPAYIIVSVVMPVIFGLAVGLGLRLIERIFGVELGRKGGH